jgi:glycosyltransferase involved in cell wall biosynthesis
MAARQLRFSFGMIVFNGETFLREVLESIYDFAYEIIVVEGPDKNGLALAGPDGGSKDRTMEILGQFPDPANKMKVIRGVWKDKDQQSNRYIKEATGDYVWHIDDDEVYKPEDLHKVERFLMGDQEITAVSFHWQNFFKSFDRVMIAEPEYEVWRLFRLRPGYVFKTHRPPTVIDPGTGVAMNDVQPLRGHQLAAAGIYIYHYSYIFDQQVKEKIEYHANYRLREMGVGIPPMQDRFGKSELARKLWQKLWMSKALLPLRKKADTGFHYDYFEKIWKAWNDDPEGIEEQYGVSPSPGPYRRTTRFTGTHPAVISERFPEARQ